MQCPRCLNTDDSYFYKGSRGWYCRKCIPFGRVMLEEEEEPVSLMPVSEQSGEYLLKYPLTPFQADISHRCALLIRTSDVLLHCVCGAGKTELVAESIGMMLKERRKVCFAIPRRQVVLELRERMAEYFPHARVIAVCGGHTSVTDADLIICTTHQLYRYFRAFDLLILDEPDAFPFKGSDVLHGIASTACRGHMVYLTATPDEELTRRVQEKTLTELKLDKRPHGKPIPVPRIRGGPRVLLFVFLLVWIRSHADHPRMIFVPSIKKAQWLGWVLNLFFRCYVCTGKTENRDEVIEKFRNEKAGLIVATTVLERGVTVSGADICIYEADSGIFDEASLIQMAGRAGRTFEHPDGDVLFLCTEKKGLVLKCRQTIMEANACGV